MSPLKAAFRSLRYLARYLRYTKNNPPVSEERDSEMSNICLWLFIRMSRSLRLPDLEPKS